MLSLLVDQGAVAYELAGEVLEASDRSHANREPVCPELFAGSLVGSDYVSSAVELDLCTFGESEFLEDLVSRHVGYAYGEEVGLNLASRLVGAAGLSREFSAEGFDGDAGGLERDSSRLAAEKQHRNCCDKHRVQFNARSRYADLGIRLG